LAKAKEGGGAVSESQLRSRDDIPSQFKCDLETLFESEGTWRDEVAAIRRDLTSLQMFRGRLAERAALVADALALAYALKERESRVFAYAQFSHLVDTTNQGAAAIFRTAQALRAQFQASTSYIQPELLRMGADALLQLPQNDSRLVCYRHYFQNLSRKSTHVLSEEVERILALLADPFCGAEATATFLLGSDISFDDAHTAEGRAVPVATQAMDLLVESPDPHLRRSAYRSLTSGLLQFRNAFASTLLTSAKQGAFTSRIRGFDSSLAAALFEDNLSQEVFDNVVACAREHLPLWQRYWKLRRKALGLDTLEPGDTWAPLTQDWPTVAYNEAVDLICEAVSPLGSEYTEVLRKGCLEDRWVDVFPSSGKVPGWLSSDEPGGPPYIILHYADTILDLGAFAHELGHSMHSFYAWRAQPMVYRPYSMLVAEVPSNFHQAMLRSFLLRSNPNSAYQLAVINEAMSNFHRYLLVMPTLAQFESQVHSRVEKGEGISADELVGLLSELMAEAYGSHVVFDRAGEGAQWARFLHLYTRFYVFKYTIGISAAHAIAQRVLSGDPGAASDYLRFLEAGDSVYPVEALNIAGVDITSRAPIDAAFSSMSQMLDRLEALI
jgi:oligoendopeptidase F